MDFENYWVFFIFGKTMDSVFSINIVTRDLVSL